MRGTRLEFDNDGTARDEFLEILAVGRQGRTLLKGFLEN